MKDHAAVITMLTAVLFTAQAQVPLGSRTSYQQDFNSLAAPPGTNNTWADNTTLPGWYAARQTGRGAPNYKTYRVGNGSTENGWIYSFGSDDAKSSSDRALGTMSSGTAKTVAIGVRFQNDTAKVTTNFVVSYTGEQWRNGGNEFPQTLAFSYLVTKTAITNSDLLTEESWVPVEKLNFTAPITGPNSTSLDGNALANRVVLSRVPLEGITLRPGEELVLRWMDKDESGPDHGMAVDDLSMTWETLPEPQTPSP